MNRSLEGWKTWYTEPLTNIGVFFVRGNQKTVKMFDMAWKDYMASVMYPFYMVVLICLTEYRQADQA